MIDFDVIDKRIYDWTVLYSSIAVIWVEDNGPKPNLPYLTLRRSTLIKYGHEYISAPNNSGIAKISGDRDLTINLQAYGSNAFGRLEDLYSAQMLPASQEFLQLGNLSLIDQLAIGNITGLNDTLFEQRAQMDLLFRLHKYMCFA